LIGHDWGSHFSLLYQIKYTSKVKKLVLLDVLTANRGQQLNSFQMIAIISYQWAFAFTYIIHELFSKSLGNILFNSIAYVFLSIIFPSIGQPRRCMSEVDASFLYPYFYFWRDYFFFSTQQPPFPNCATLLLYGADKTLHFHGSHAATELSSMPNCVVKSIPGGHWFHLQQPTMVLKEISTFFGDD
jgi:pimeloyl-ACP methyl ester carboxylesterase